MREEGMVGRRCQSLTKTLHCPVNGSSKQGFQAESLGMAVVLWLVTEIPDI